MAKEKKEKESESPAKGFSGVARSVICHNTNGMFRNFKIVTLTLENGKLVKEEYSDPWASWETISRAEVLLTLGVLHLNDHWREGATLTK